MAREVLAAIRQVPSTQRQTITQEARYVNRPYKPDSLTDQIRHSVDNPVTKTGFDFTSVLYDVLSTVGVSVEDAEGRFASMARPGR